MLKRCFCFPIEKFIQKNMWSTSKTAKTIIFWKEKFSTDWKNRMSVLFNTLLKTVVTENKGIVQFDVNRRLHGKTIHLHYYWHEKPPHRLSVIKKLPDYLFSHSIDNLEKGYCIIICDSLSMFEESFLGYSWARRHSVSTIYKFQNWNLNFIDLFEELIAKYLLKDIIVETGPLWIKVFHELHTRHTEEVTIWDGAFGHFCWSSCCHKNLLWLYIWKSKTFLVIGYNETA